MKSTINTHYTFNYSQPLEYRFSHDSVFMARKIFDCLNEKDLKNARALDVCSGCGIIGMDFLFHRRADGASVPQFFDFLDIQSVYLSHFVENKNRLGKIDSEISFLNYNYNILQRNQFKECYDLMVCNPPYFDVTQGKLSPSDFKNRCRFYIDSDLKNLISSIENGLKKSGECYLLMRSLEEHGLDVVAETQKLSEGSLSVNVVESYRRTNLLLLKRF